MKKNLFAWFCLILFFAWNCSNHTDRKSLMDGENIVLQEGDGTISLKIDNAACYSDITDPSSNTAEWQVSISKPGRYKVWLSSATKDTLTLSYANKVKIHLLDNQLEVSPVCDKIIQNSNDVSYPFYRADSYMGAFYIQNPGVYVIQVISEKVLPKEVRDRKELLSGNTRLISVILEPLKR